MCTSVPAHTEMCNYCMNITLETKVSYCCLRTQPLSSDCLVLTLPEASRQSFCAPVSGSLESRMGLWDVLYPCCQNLQFSVEVLLLVICSASFPSTIHCQWFFFNVCLDFFLLAKKSIKMITKICLRIGLMLTYHWKKPWFSPQHGINKCGSTCL